MKKHFTLLWAIFSAAFVLIIGYKLLINWEHNWATNQFRTILRIFLVFFAAYQSVINFKFWINRNN